MMSAGLDYSRNFMRSKMQAYIPGARRRPRGTAWHRRPRERRCRPAALRLAGNRPLVFLACAQVPLQRGQRVCADQAQGGWRLGGGRGAWGAGLQRRWLVILTLTACLFRPSPNAHQLLLFPYTHKSWRRRSAGGGDGHAMMGLDTDGGFDGPMGAPAPVEPAPAQDLAPPLHDVNAPDLYIPTMSFITFVLLVGLLEGTRMKYGVADARQQGSGRLTPLPARPQVHPRGAVGRDGQLAGDGGGRGSAGEAGALPDARGLAAGTRPGLAHRVQVLRVREVGGRWGVGGWEGCGCVNALHARPAADPAPTYAAPPTSRLCLITLFGLVFGQLGLYLALLVAGAGNFVFTVRSAASSLGPAPRAMRHARSDSRRPLLPPPLPPPPAPQLRFLNAALSGGETDGVARHMDPSMAKRLYLKLGCAPGPAHHAPPRPPLPAADCPTPSHTTQGRCAAVPPHVLARARGLTRGARVRKGTRLACDGVPEQINAHTGTRKRAHLTPSRRT